ncbi:hypothetical protein LH51_09360 [Nitrincola sp. A-D6]|uniref:hypothetical protein n=1 Tax=Nitrincola sp. A-D6 TaxID=1545442 RepID=UPI00051F9942|nr:hypothetical protein [Nitrincola sp. A-D6]KGK42180.1 hypothetical protein LH51_09360 [Nitrincola sp. A-D6]
MLVWSLSRLGVDNYRSYVSPVFWATLVHVMMLVLIAGQWFDFSESPRPQPRHLQARMIDMSSLQPDQAAAQQAAEQARARSRRARQSSSARSKPWLSSSVRKSSNSSRNNTTRKQLT